MKNSKRIISTVLCTSMLLTSICAADITGTIPKWAEESVQKAVESNLLGSIDDNMAIGAPVSRAAFAAVINSTFGANKMAALKDFDNVSGKQWGKDAMAVAANMGTFQNFDLSDNNITREQSFAVISRAFEFEPVYDIEVLAKFSDADEISQWALPYVCALVKAGYVNGSNGKLLPKSNVKMTEVCQVASNIVGNYVDASQSDKTFDQSVMLRSGDVKLENIVITGDLYVGDGVTSLELNNCIIKGRIIIRGGAKNDNQPDDSSKPAGSSGIKFVNTVVTGDVVLNNPNGETKLDIKSDPLTAKPETKPSEQSIKNLVVKSNITLDTNQTVDNLNIAGVVEATLEKANITNLQVSEKAVGATIGIGKDANVKTADVSADSVIIGGAGKLESIKVNSSYVYVTTLNTKVEASKDSVGVMAGDVTLKPSESIITSSSSKNPSSKPAQKELDSYISQLQSLESEYTSALSSIYNEMQQKYKAGASKSAIQSEAISRANLLEVECDGKFNAVLDAMRLVVVNGNLNSSVLGEARSTYLQRKSEVRSQYEAYLN